MSTAVTKVWDPGTYMFLYDFLLNKLQEIYTVLNFTLNFLKYTSIKIFQLLREGQELNEQTVRNREGQELKEQTVRKDYSYTTFTITDFDNCKLKVSLQTIYNLFSEPVPQHIKSLIIQGTTIELAQKSETDLYSIYSEYRLMTMNSTVTEEDVCLSKIDPFYRHLLELCCRKKLIKQAKDNKYNEIMVKNVDFLISKIEKIITRKEYKLMSKTCIFLLHMFNIDTSRDQLGGLQNQEELTCLLSDSLRMLPEANFYGTFEVYFKQVEMMNLSVRFEVLCTSFGRINPHLKLKLIVSYCEHLIKHKHYQTYQEFIVKHLHLFIDVTVTSGEENRTISHDCDLCDQINKQWNNEGYRIMALTCLLSRLLHMLPDDERYETITYYQLLVKKMKSDITPKYLHSVKTESNLNQLFKNFWFLKLINVGPNRCQNNFDMEKNQEKKADLTVQLMKITENLSDDSFLKESLKCYLNRNIKTVTSMTTRSNDGWIWNMESNPACNKSRQDLIYTQCAFILSGKKMKNVDIQQYSRKLNMKGPEAENETETHSEQVKLMKIFIFLLLLTALGQKSAKLKKYLALKYEYDMASLYLLWCSGDIEVHPGPAWRRKQLEHNSEQKRKWLQDINGILLKLYWRIPTHSKPKKLWQKDNQPDRWPSDKPFYDTKNYSKDAEGNTITDDEILKSLIKCLEWKEVDIPHIYQSEISAWTNKNIQLLHKLQVYRIEMEKIKSSSLNLFLSNLEDDSKYLQDIKVSLKKSTLDKMQIEGLLNNDLRQKKLAEMVAEITRDLANTLCRLAKGIDPMEKGDGIWNMPPPVDWPEDVPFFNPKNRGNNKDKPKCPDTVLVCTFLKLRHLRIPENLKQIVDAYKTMYNCTDIDVKKKNKDELCRLYTIQSNLEKLDCSLQNLHEEGLFSREVNAILDQWRKTQSVDEHAEHDLKSAMVRSDERPYITIDISKNFEQDTDLRYICYSIPIKGAYLHIKCTKTHPNQSSHEQTITEPFVQANSSENIEDDVLPPDVIDFVLEHDFVNQTKSPNDSSVMNTDNGPMPIDLQRQGTPLPIRHQHLTPYNDLDTLTTHNTLASDLNSRRYTTEYVTSVQDCKFVYNSRGNTGENLGGNMGTSIVKRKRIEDSEKPVKKLLKTKVNQFGHSDRTDGEISSSESKNDGGSLSSSNQTEICNDNVPDSASLDFNLSDRIGVNGRGNKCNSKPSENSGTFQQICDLENINSSNQKDSHENINELNYIDNQMIDQTDDKTELEKCLEMIKYLSR